MVSKKVIKLPSSKKVFGHDDGTCDVKTLVSLLGEGLKRKLKSMDKISIIEEYLPAGVCDNPTTANLKDRKSTITYGRLNELYVEFFDKKYSSEAEQEREEFNKEMTIKSYSKQVPR